jgi:hypothetical protein
VNVREARAFLESRRGDQYGPIGVALNVLLPYAASRFEAIEGQVDRLTRERDAANRRVADAQQLVDDLAVAVHAAIDGSGTLSDAVAHISLLLTAYGRPPQPVERLGAAPAWVETS